MPKFRFLRVLLSVSIALAMTPAAAFALQDDEGSNTVTTNEIEGQGQVGANDTDLTLASGEASLGADEALDASGNQADGELDDQENLAAGANEQQGSVEGADAPNVDDQGVLDEDEADEESAGADGEADGKKDAEADDKEGEDAEKDRSSSEEATRGSAKPAHVLYKAHVSYVGWQKEYKDGKTAGTTGRSLAIEALQIKLDGIDGGVSYSAHVSQIGWQDAVADGETAGTTGQSLAIEAVRISLTAPAADSYDIYYRVHSSNLGWLGWARNGEPAGSAGQGLAVEAIEIVLVSKGASFDEYGAEEAFSEQVLTYAANVAGRGWQAQVGDGELAGTTGQGLPVDQLRVKNTSTVIGGAVVAQGYTEFVGWKSSVSNGTIGVKNQSRHLQAIKLSLTGEMAERYDIYYRTHISYVGWLDWASNGAPAGSVGFGQHIEAVEITLVEKGGAAPGATDEAFQSNDVFHYSAHVQNYGWMTPVESGETAGTTGQGLRIEALSMTLGELAGSIEYRAHVSNVGWQDWVADGAIAGTEGKSQAIEAVQIRLSGEAAENYDIYYRVHSANFGWLGWAKNGESAGSENCALRAEAIEIQLVKKGEAGPSSSGSAFRTLSYSYKANSQSVGWQDEVTNGADAGTTGKSRAIYQLSTTTNATGLTGEMQISVHTAYVGWEDYVGSGAIASDEKNQVEAIKVKLTGELAQYFDVWYRVHSSNLGWLGWAKNGAPAGTESLGYAAEAVDIMILPKGSAAPGSTTMPYRNWSYVKLAQLLDSFFSGSFQIFGTNRGLSSSTYTRLIEAIRNYTGDGLSVGFVMIDLETGAGVAYNADTDYTSCCTVKAPYIVALNKYWPWTYYQSEYDMRWSLWNSTNSTYFNLVDTYGYGAINQLLAEVNASIGWYGPGYYGWYSAKDLAKMWLPMSEYLLFDSSENAAYLRDLMGQNMWITTREAISADAVYAKSGWIDTQHNEGALVVKNGHPYVITIMSTSSPYQSWRMTELVQALDRVHTELTR